MSRFVPSKWTRSGPSHGGNHARKVPGTDWTKGGVSSFRRKTTVEREAELVQWNAGKFIIFCYVCGHKKKSDHFDEEQIYTGFPWCRQCQREDKNEREVG